MRAIIVCFVFNLCFGLLYLGLTVAFNAYVASCTIFLNVSYAMPVVILLIRGRKILLHMPGTPFKLGISGSALNWISVIFVGVTSVVGLIRIIVFAIEIPADFSVVLLLPSCFASI
jgi:choline transport protein